MAKDMIREMWDKRHITAQANKEEIKKELVQLERKADALLERIKGTDDAPLITSYEGKLKKIVEQKTLLREQLAFTPTKKKDFEEAFRTPLEVLKNPVKLW